MIDFLAAEPHYLDHLLSIRDELAARGVDTRLFVFPQVENYAAHIAVAHEPWEAWTGKGLCLVSAAARDFLHDQHLWHVLVEHGVGQQYIDQPDHTGYPGGKNRDGIDLYLVPNETVAVTHERAVVVGCPKLDRYHRSRDEGSAVGRRAPAQRPLVAVSFHWRCDIANEAGTAWDEYRVVLPELVEWARTHGVRLLGHAHPKIADEVLPEMDRFGMPITFRFAEVLRRADLYVCDNSSTLYEFASLDKPVLCLNASWWRRDVEQLPRFWSGVPGIQCDEPAGLIAGIEWALEDQPAAQVTREQAVEQVYAYTDGKAAVRAADAILDLVA